MQYSLFCRNKVNHYALIYFVQTFYWFYYLILHATETTNFPCQMHYSWNEHSSDLLLLKIVSNKHSCFTSFVIYGQSFVLFWCFPGITCNQLQARGLCLQQRKTCLELNGKRLCQKILLSPGFWWYPIT